MKIMISSLFPMNVKLISSHVEIQCMFFFSDRNPCIAHKIISIMCIILFLPLR